MELYNGLQFYYKDQPTLFTIHLMDDYNIKITWGDNNSVVYTKNQAIENFKDRTWIVKDLIIHDYSIF